MIKSSARQENQVISLLFMRDKKDGRLSVIFDLSESNEYIVYRHFKMETFETALNLASENSFFASVEWVGADYTEPVAVDDENFLKFKRRNCLYQYTVLAEA